MQNQLARPALPIPMSSPDISTAEIDAVNAVLRTPVLSIGPQVQAFEKAIASFVGCHYGIAVNSGTSGLHLAVIAAGVQAEDEVITSSFSFIASANSIVYERAKPVFVDIDPITGNIDPALIEAAITPRTKAIMPIHAFGQPADMDPILDIAARHQLVVIEDACEALGAHYKGKPVGTFGAASIFAFYPNKQITTGEGGMIVTDNAEWDALFRSLRNQGRDVFDAWLNHSRLGYNYRLDELSAALGVAQLARIEGLLQKREQVAAWYTERLREVPGLTPPQVVASTTRMSWFVYVVAVQSSTARDALMHYLQTQGIPSRPYFTPIHLQPYYQQQFGWKLGDLPRTEKAGATALALPFSSVMSEDQVDYVCQQVRLGMTKIMIS